ncbi:MAG: hypothetical protein KDK69_05930, partial [Chlamydiia bacterium]|nr:hypothetical protein [Chlamydiia bacterium]
LVKEAHIMPPSQMGSLEQALYYEPPSSKAVGRMGAMLKEQPSLSHHRLHEYERQLTLVQKYFQTDSASFEEQERKEFVNQLGFPNQRKTRAHIEEDMKEEIPPERKSKQAH